MLTPLIVSLAAAITSTTAPPPPARAGIPPDGRVTWQGVRFQLPPGLSCSIEETEGGRREWHARGADAAVTVTIVRSDTELPCEVEDPGEADPGFVEIEPFDTSGGLRACRVGASDAGVRFETTFVKDGDILVIVRGVATGGAAPRLVRRVAESIRVDRARAARATALPRVDVPVPEPRLQGCFEHTVHVEGANAHVVRTRCFRPDFTFTLESIFLASFGSRNFVSEGTWAYADGHLLLEDEDGDQLQFEIEFTDGNVVANGNLWERR